LTILEYKSQPRRKRVLQEIVNVRLGNWYVERYEPGWWIIVRDTSTPEWLATRTAAGPYWTYQQTERAKVKFEKAEPLHMRSGKKWSEWEVA
jgi:hypothetical protein